MEAEFRRESVRLRNGATLWCWALRTADGEVIDESLATAPTEQDGHIYFVTSENVDCLEAVVPVARVAEMPDGKHMTLYKVPKKSCTWAVRPTQAQGDPLATGAVTPAAAHAR